MSTEPAPKKPEFLDELSRAAVASLVEDSGLDPEAAQAAADFITDRVRRDLGGVNFYIAKGKYAEVEVMRQDIGRNWNSQNTFELCRKWGISHTWLRELHDQYHGRPVRRGRDAKS